MTDAQHASGAVKGTVPGNHQSVTPQNDAFINTGPNSVQHHRHIPLLGCAAVGNQAETSLWHEPC